MATPGLSLDEMVKKLQVSCEKNIHDDPLNWKNLLENIKSVFYDNDKMPVTVESVKIWFGVQNLADDFDQFLVEFDTLDRQKKSLLEPAQPRTSKFRRLITTCFANFNPPSSIFDSMMMPKIKKMTVRLQDIVKKTNLRRIPTTSLENKDIVYGRDKDKEVIVNLLLRPFDDGFSVIPITGNRGIGKTTLTQLVYNDVQVQDHFDLKVWVCVSENYDDIRVTKIILMSTDDHPIEHDDFNLLQEKLKKKLVGKKFLLVLDDVRPENYNNWTSFICPFKAGIVVTTRYQGVAETMGTIPAYPLKELPNDDYLHVLAQHSLGTEDFSTHESLKEIVEKIVIRRSVLPLIAKTLGCHLRSKYDPNEWENVLNGKD